MSESKTAGHLPLQVGDRVVNSTNSRAWTVLPRLLPKVTYPRCDMTSAIFREQLSRGGQDGHEAWQAAERRAARLCGCLAHLRVFGGYRTVADREGA